MSNPDTITTVPMGHIDVEINVEGVKKTHRVMFRQSEGFIYREIFEQNTYSLLPNRSHPGPLNILDMGAHVGLFALYATVHFSPCWIHCFEPFEPTFRLLEKNLEPFPNIFLHNFGLSDREGEFPIFAHPDHACRNSIKLLEADLLANGTVRIRNAREQVNKIGFPRIDVLKMDTEGCEVEILKSLGSSIYNEIDYILLEYHSEADRRSLDQMLSSFTLFGSLAKARDRGTCKYVRTALLESSQA